MWDLGFSFCSGFLYLTCFTKYSIILLTESSALTMYSFEMCIDFKEV